MIKVKLVMLVATAVAASVFAGCTKDDDTEVTRTYTIKLSSVCPYDAQRYSAADSLVAFITGNMGLERDTVPNTWLVSAGTIKACDKIILDLFERACSMVDPELYAGKYTVYVMRDDNADGAATIAEKEFVAAQGNGQGKGTDKIEWDFTVEVPEGSYIYDVAISSGDTYGYAIGCLTDSGYTALDGDLNVGTFSGKYIFMGYKMAKGDKPTEIKGYADNMDGDMVPVSLTAREAAISCFICIQDCASVPDKCKGDPNGFERGFVFEKFRTLGMSDGNTNQGVKNGKPSFLYFSRSNNASQYVTALRYARTKTTSPYSNISMVKKACYNQNDGTCIVLRDNADLNAGKSDILKLWVFLGYLLNND